MKIKNLVLIATIVLGFGNKVHSSNIDSGKTVISMPSHQDINVSGFDKNVLEIELIITHPLDTTKTKDILLKISADSNDFDNRFLSLYNETILISKKELNSSDTVKRRITGIIKIDTSFHYNYNKLLSIKIEADGDKKSDSILVSNCIVKVMLSSRNAHGFDGVSLALGTNFDLADGVKLNSFYGRLSFVDHEILNTDCLPFNKMGIYGGVYQDRYLSTETTTPEMEFYRVLSIYSDDSIRVNRTFATQKSVTTYNNYGLLVSFPFTVSEKERDKHRGYFSVTCFDFEALLRKNTTTYTYTNATSDTIKIQRDSITNKNVAIDKFEEDFFDKYWGAVTLQYSMSGEKYTVFMKGTPLGIYWHDQSKGGIAFYSFYFGITEKALGIRIGGEFKGLYGKGNPFLNLFITKSFDLSNFGKALVGGN